LADSSSEMKPMSRSYRLKCALPGFVRDRWRVAALMLAAVPAMAYAQHNHDAQEPDPTKPLQDALVFVSTRYSSTNADVPQPFLDDGELRPSVDLFYTRTHERFGLLAEYLVTNDEHDLERLQIGWHLSDGTRLLFGRFHQSASYWNTEHHHGQFLQTTIYRPAIEEFEDTGSILPSHTTGVLLEHRKEFRDGAGIQVSASAGLTAVVSGGTPRQIEPFDLLHPESGHGNSVSLRVSLFPDVLADNQIGFTYGHYSINFEPGLTLPAQWTGLAGVALTEAGFYGDWSKGHWRLLGSARALAAEPRGGSGGATSHSTFVYAQAEYKLQPRWTAYGRVERTSGDSDYADIFPTFLRDQSLVGARLLLKKNHAFTMEVGTASTSVERFHRVSVQWSAVFP
jgi:hypothetical protein